MLKQILVEPTRFPQTNGNHAVSKPPTNPLFEPHEVVAITGGQVLTRKAVEDAADEQTAPEEQTRAIAPGNSRLRDTAVGFQLIVRELYDEANDLISKLDPFLVKGEAIKFVHEPAAGLKPHDTIHHEAEQVGNLLVTLRALKTRIDA